MPWLDLEEGILDEFAERSAVFDPYDAIRAHGDGMFTFARSERKAESCFVCGAQVKRNAETCSKRCTQIRRRRELIKLGTCTQCKVRPAKSYSQTCNECGTPRAVVSANGIELKTERCARNTCCNHVVVGAGRTAKYCRDTCKNRDSERRKQESVKPSSDPAPGDRVLVVSCSSGDSDVRGPRSLFIGKRGRVSIGGSVLTVQFYGGKRAQFYPSELSKIS